MFEHYNFLTTEIERLCIKNTMLLFENYLIKKQSSKLHVCIYIIYMHNIYLIL